MSLYPETPIAKEITLESVQPVINSFSTSGRRQTRIVEGHLWKMEAKYDIMERVTISPLFGYVMGVFGVSFDIILPNFKTSLGDGTGSPQTFIALVRGGSICLSDGWTGGAIAMKTGDIFQFQGYSKVYMLTTDATQASGNATLNFKPPLIEDIPVDTPIIYNDVKFRVVIDGDINKWNTRNPLLSKYTLNMIEAV